MKKRQNKKFDLIRIDRPKRMAAAGLRFLWQNQDNHFDAFHAVLWPMRKTPKKTRHSKKP